MTKNFLRVFPFLSVLFLLFLFSILSSFALATSDLFLEESLKWADEPSVSTGWQVLISFDALFIFCVLAWILYTYCCPQRVWSIWQKLFVFFSMSNKEENRKRDKPKSSFLENKLRTWQPSIEKGERKPFRWMNIEEAK